MSVVAGRWNTGEYLFAEPCEKAAFWAAFFVGVDILRLARTAQGQHRMSHSKGPAPDRPRPAKGLEGQGPAAGWRG